MDVTKPFITVAPAFDATIARLGDGYTDTDRGDHIERLCHVVPLTPDDAYRCRLAACHADRRAAYPSLGDQMDAAFKARAGDPGPQTAIDAAIAAVKARYPKPTPQ